MTTTRQLSTHAHAAKLIRQELKKAFPAIAFRVRARSFSGGDAIDIEWSNGPTVETLAKITNKYQYGHFNGMEDIYENTNSRNDIPQVKYVHERREISEDMLRSVFESFRTNYHGWENLKSMDETSADLMNKWSHWTAREFIDRKLSSIDLTNGYSEE